MLTIHKYKIGESGLLQPRVVVDMPRDAEILCADFQGTDICVWAKVVVNDHEDTQMFPRVFRIFGTGHEIPEEIDDQLVHVSTVQDVISVDGQKFVWHIFLEVE